MSSTAPLSGLRPRHDPGTSVRLRRSAACVQETWPVAELTGWLTERAAAAKFEVDRIPFARLDGWRFDEATGNLVHRSGRFFSVEGLRVRMDTGPCPEWHQPIIKQPEVGILGILAKEFDGVLHFLMQAKMEPGNPNLLQLSPTVQATRSNYTKVHSGRDVTYLEYFTEPQRHGRVIADVLQSEHGGWFYRKHNRNMIIEVFDDVTVRDDFRWLTLGQLGRLLRLDNVVNMDARTVLACAPVDHEDPVGLHSDTELLSWLTAQRCRREISAELVPLTGLPGWKFGEYSIDHEDGRHFGIVAVSVRAGNREVESWAQPLLEPRGRGVIAFVFRSIGAVPHLLAHARAEAGLRETVELAPTVQYMSIGGADLTAADRSPFLDLVMSADPARIRYQAVHSEEGGRFLNSQSRYLVIEADESEAPLCPPPGYMWVTPGQLGSLAGHGHYVNVQARTLLACFNTRAMDLVRPDRPSRTTIR